MLKISKNLSSSSQNILKENIEIFRTILIHEVNISKLINYSTNMCLNGQNTTIHFFKGLMIENFILE